MQLTLIRHTTPRLATGLCYGQSDVDLAESFGIEAGAVKDKLAALAPDATFSSPLRRCARLVDALGWGETQFDARLMELHFGSWEQQSWDAIPRMELDTWSRDYVDTAPPQGESFAQLHARAMAFLGEIRARHAGQSVAVVTHAGVVRALLAEALGLPLKEVFRFRLDFGGVTHLDFNGAVPAVVAVNR